MFQLVIRCSRRTSFLESELVSVLDSRLSGEELALLLDVLLGLAAGGVGTVVDIVASCETGLGGSVTVEEGSDLVASDSETTVVALEGELDILEVHGANTGNTSTDLGLGLGLLVSTGRAREKLGKNTKDEGTSLTDFLVEGGESACSEFFVGKTVVVSEGSLNERNSNLVGNQLDVLVKEVVVTVPCGVRSGSEECQDLGVHEGGDILVVSGISIGTAVLVVAASLVGKGVRGLSIVSIGGVVSVGSLEGSDIDGGGTVPCLDDILAAIDLRSAATLSSIACLLAELQELCNGTNIGKSLLDNLFVTDASAASGRVVTTVTEGVEEVGVTTLEVGFGLLESLFNPDLHEVVLSEVVRVLRVRDGFTSGVGRDGFEVLTISVVVVVFTGLEGWARLVSHEVFQFLLDQILLQESGSIGTWKVTGDSRERLGRSRGRKPKEESS